MIAERKKSRLTLGSLMLLIATLAWIMASHAYLKRENARAQEAELARIDAELKQTIAANEAEAAKDEEMERKNDEAMAKARETLERAKQPQLQAPPISSLPGQVQNILNLLAEQKKLEAKSKRMHEEIAGKIRERMDKQRLEPEASKAMTPPAEQPR